MAATPDNIPSSLHRPTTLDRFRLLWSRRETIRFLTSSNLKAGHRDKALGHLWNLLDPMMFMLVYYFVFGVLFGMSGGGRSAEFMLYILIAVLTWRFIEGTIGQSANCIRSNRGLIHEINFPKAVFPVSIALSRMYDLAWGFVVLIVFLLFAQIWPTFHYLWVPILLASTFLFVLGVAFIVAYMGAFFADTSNVVNVAMRLLFYCSPIFYFVRDEGHRTIVKNGVKHVVPKYRALFHNETVRIIYMANPFACFFECLRDAMLWGRAPDPHKLEYAVAVSIVTFVVGFAIFCRGEGKFAKYV